MPFAEIPGQQRATERVQATLRSGRTPHAFLFVGAPGTGREPMARALAQVVMCTDRPAPDAYCDECHDCDLLRHGNHPDLHIYGVPENRTQFPVDLVREEIIPQAGRKPTRVDRAVFLIRDVERMNDSSYNTLLKTLEEPPPGAMFVLLSQSMRNIPETIISRCRVVRFRNLEPQVLADRLAEHGIDRGDALWLARRCWGSPGLAERLADMDLPAVNQRMLKRLARLRPTDNFELSDGVESLARDHGEGATDVRDLIQEVLECIVVYYRDLALAAACEQPDLFNESAAEQIAARAEGGHPDEFADRAELVLETMDAIEQNGNVRLQLDHLFTQLGMRHARG
jgi:DNA polymerase-3 subunit delta'